MNNRIEELREQWHRENPDVQMRTCWNCNPAHAHFKEWDASLGLLCFGCGHWYYQGVDITIDEEDAWGS